MKMKLINNFYIFFLWIDLMAICATIKESFRGYTLFYVTPNTEDKFNYLISLYNGSSELELDFWHAPSSLGEPAEIFVQPSMTSRLIKDLSDKKIDYNMTTPNLQVAMEEEKRPAPGGKKRIFKDESSFHLAQYNSYTEIEKYLKKAAEGQRDTAKLESIGKSHEGRDLWMIRLGDTRKKTDKPAIWIDAGIHAREWISPATILYIVDILAHANETNNAKVKRYLEEIDWYILPVMNPDGYAYTHAKDRMWRKNRSPCPTQGRKCCQGVDLNRNFGAQWGTTGASRNPCSNTYMGAKAFSEPESKAVHDFVKDNANNIKVFMTFHSYGQLWMYPYGYKKKTYPEDVDDIRDLSNLAVDAIKSVHGTKFKVGTAANILYLASGASEDWAKADAKIKYAYTVELRPSGLGGGFVISPKYIMLSGEEIWAALQVIADKVIEKFGSSPENEGSTASTSEPLGTKNGKIVNETVNSESSDGGEF